MGALKTFLAGLGAFLSALVAAWEAHQRKQAREAVQDGADRIAADPGTEWMRRFNEQANPPTKADAGKPDGDK